MESTSELPAPGSVLHARRVLIVEAPPGDARRALVREHLARAATTAGATTWALECAFATGGPWAGARDLLRELLPRLERAAPDLLARHAYELCLALPALRRRLAPAQLTLMDTAPADERTRAYAIDRADRVVHGLVDLVRAWRAHAVDASPWVIACEDFDQGGHLAQRFVHELFRRGGDAMDLTLVLAVAPGAAEHLAAAFAPRATVVRSPCADAPPAPPPPTPRELAERAAALEARVAADPDALPDALPALIDLWTRSDAPERAWPLRARAVAECAYHGFYHDARRYAEPMMPQLDAALAAGLGFPRWTFVNTLAHCFIALGQVDLALEVCEREGVAKITAPGERVRALYTLAMFHARYLPARDLARAERLLAEALEILPGATELPAHRRDFLHVFLHNGLALVRHRQGRPEEALRLCREGFALLEARVPSGQHQVHRSALLHNIAQVYAGMGAFADAERFYTRALAIDPNASEFYNERGIARLNLGRHVEAAADFETATRLGPPYPEAWTNLGQARKLLEQFEPAARAYDRAIDLAPGGALSWLGRAQCHEALGRPDAALADYAQALALDPAQPLALANRARLRYDAGDVGAALADLDAAVALAPALADLRFNRAAALADLGRRAEAAADLRAYLALAPGAEDAPEVRARLAALAPDAADARDG